MNKEKLIDIILKDLDELKDISEDIKKGSSVSKLETDIALSKATLILQEFQLLKEKYTEETTSPVVEEVKMVEITKEEKPIISKPIEKEPEPQIVSETLLELDNDAEPFEDELPEDGSDEDDEFEEEMEEESDDFEVDEELEPEEEPEEEEEEVDDDYDDGDDDDEKIDDDFDDAIDEDDEIPPTQAEKKMVGENFHIEKSLNDTIGNSNNTLDQKIAHSRITSLQSAIGINDRFLFIRELFNNDGDLYMEAIKRLDQCEDIREAVEYLSSNFKIKKTETSLKFVELIKRRFAK